MPRTEGHRWIPDIAVKLEVLGSELSAGSMTAAELTIDGTPTPCHLGMSVDGAVWLTIGCEPRTVSVDDTIAAVDFKILPNGYRLKVAPEAPVGARNHLLEEIVQLLGDGHPPGDAGVLAIRSWRELLARAPGERLSQRALVGLYGELEVLEAVLEAGGDLNYWTGWNLDHCDFRMTGLVIEVKTTTSADYRRVRIHGLAQLDDPQDGSDLLLVLKRLESSPDGRSVPDLIERLVILGSPRSVLLERLTDVGYFEHHSASYENERFMSREVALRHIDQNHPRLVPSMLVGVDTSSVDKIDYELNLNGTADADLRQTLPAILKDHLDSA